MKYVMFQCQSLPKVKGEEVLLMKVPVIFPDFMVHQDCEQVALHWLRRRHGFVSVHAISAGFIDLGTCKTYGKSESLGLNADPEDGSTISTYNYTHGL